MRRSGEEDEDTIPCPYCGRAMYEDAPACPHCGNYISDEDAPPGPKPWWLIVGALVCLAILLLWVLGG